MGYNVVNADQIEPAGPGGAVRFVRRELGVPAFGVNWFELGPHQEGREHAETGSGQEGVSVVIAGSRHRRVDGEVVPVRAGSFVRVDPESSRVAVTGPDGMTFVAIGAPRAGYQPRGSF